MLEKVRDMEIYTHKLTLRVSKDLTITVYQDFNCRFTREPILFVIFVAPKGHYTTIE